MSRIKSSIRNVSYGIGSQVVIVLVTLATRSLFAALLGKDYLGLNTLFQSVISILSLTELGFGSAALFALYRPIAENDRERIAGLMHLYAKIYKIMFFVVLGFGLALMPFLHYLIKDMPDNIRHLNVIYLMFVLNSAVSYLFSYKRSLLFADQKNYKILTVTTVMKVALSLSQLVGLWVTQGNYFIYLALMIFFTFSENVFISVQVKREYPWLGEYKKTRVSDADKHSLVSNTKALLLHRIGAIAVLQSDNLITSAFINLATLGIYSNYQLIWHTLQTAVSNIMNGLQASIGNFNVSAPPEQRLDIFNKLNLAMQLICSFCTVGLFCLSSPVIDLIFGASYVFPTSTVLIISLYFYFLVMRTAHQVIKDTCGLFRPDRYKPLVEAVFNVVFSIILVKLIGFNGVLIATIADNLLIAYPVEVYVVFKYALGTDMWKYYRRFFVNLAVLAVQMGATWFACSLVGPGGIAGIAIKAVICCTVPNAVSLLAFYRTRSFKELAATARRLIAERGDRKKETV